MPRSLIPGGAFRTKRAARGAAADRRRRCSTRRGWFPPPSACFAAIIRGSPGVARSSSLMGDYDVDQAVRLATGSTERAADPGAARHRQDVLRRADRRRADAPGPAGRRRGASHKAIHNLLHEIERLAREHGVRVPRAARAARARTPSTRGSTSTRSSKATTSRRAPTAGRRPADGRHRLAVRARGHAGASTRC